MITQVNLLFGLLSPTFPSACFFHSYCFSSLFLTSLKMHHMEMSSFLVTLFLLLLSSLILFLFLIILLYSSTFIPLPYPITPHYTLGCASTVNSLVFLLLLHTSSTLSIYMYIISKIPVQQAPNTHTWLMPNLLGLFPTLRCFENILRGFLSYLNFPDYCCFYFNNLGYIFPNQVRKLILYFKCYLFHLSLYNG
jgi:hypothetical protein